MGRYRQGRKLLYAAVALFLLVVVVPLSIGAIEWYNENIAGTDSVAYAFNNKTAIQSFFVNTVSAAVGADIITTVNRYTAALSPFYDVTYNNQTGWNEVFITTGATGTDNLTTKNTLFFSMNISAQDLINCNANKIHLILYGLNTNTSADIYMKIAAVSVFFADPVAYSLDDASTGWTRVAAAQLIENSTLDYTLKLDPAVLSYIASKTNDTYVLKIALISSDPAKEIISEGDTVYFKIQVLHPHGRAVLFTYDITKLALAGWTVVGIFVFVVTSPMWNPTTKNGLISHILHQRKRARAASSRGRSRSKSRRSRSHRRRGR